MFLSRLILNPRERFVRRDLANCQDLHRTLLKAFPAKTSEDKGARAEFGLLYRVEIQPRASAVTVLVQSQCEPDWQALPPGYLLDTVDNPACRSLADAYGVLQDGIRLRFRLRANPTRAITAFDAQGQPKKNSQRVDIRGEQNQLAWLEHQAVACGFRLLTLRAQHDVPNAQAQPAGKTLGWRADEAGQRKRLTLAAVVFEGELLVTAAEQFQRALRQGIGRGKAYGFGLLSIARAA